MWTGTVINPAQAEDEAVPRTVSMAWGDVCDTEVSRKYIQRGYLSARCSVRIVTGHTHTYATTS